jgi:mannonate dehydratase
MIFGLSGCAALYDRLGGPYRGAPGEIYGINGLDGGARQLVAEAFDEFEGETLNDFHVHFFGNGRPAIYTYCPGLNRLQQRSRPRMNFERFIEHQEWWQRPFIQGIYLDTIEVTDLDRMDEQYMKRLVDLVANYGPPGEPETPTRSRYRTNFHLMAMDGIYDADGEVDERSFNYASNEYIVELVHCLNKKLDESDRFSGNRFVAVGSINPLRANRLGETSVMRDRQDWSREIRLLRDNGVRWIKWRPGSMQLDPELVSDEFYRELRKNDIGILTHTGSSNGVKLDEAEDQLAGPSRMRRALELGVRVVLLHMGRTGQNSLTGKAFSDEFLSMLRDPAQGWNIRGELSAVPYDGTQELLRNISKGDGELYINGSDYPAVSPYVLVKSSLTGLRKAGLLSGEETDSLDAVFKYNPLLFDFVLKRTLARNGLEIPASVFAGAERSLAGRVREE